MDECFANPTAKPWQLWRLAKSLKLIISEIDMISPGRSRTTDGAFGDEAHQSTISDHNPWVWDDILKLGVVTAIDITHDPVGGCNCNSLADFFQITKDDRIKYVIWDGKIMSSYAQGEIAPWIWRSYSGSNPHTTHMHISVKCNLVICDDTTINWGILPSNLI